MSTFKDIATLYSPMKELGPEDEGYRYKPAHQPITVTKSSFYRGPNDALLGYVDHFASSLFASPLNSVCLCFIQGELRHAQRTATWSS